MPIDLHTHTYHSDGQQSPSALVDEASDKDVWILAVTDHDSVAGVSEAARRGKERGIYVIPAVEISANVGMQEYHILGYGIDHTHETLLKQLAQCEIAKNEQVEAMYRRLLDMGYILSWERVLDTASTEALTVPLLGQVLVEEGYMESVDAARHALLNKGGDAYVPRQTITPVEAVGLIAVCGGVPVLAHPAVSGSTPAVQELAGCGLLGIEAYYPRHSAAQTAMLLRLAAEIDLIVTGGSDYHGPTGPHSSEGTYLGCVPVPEACGPELLAATAAARSNDS